MVSSSLFRDFLAAHGLSGAFSDGSGGEVSGLTSTAILLILELS